MLNKIIVSITRVHPLFYIVPYILLQAYLYFSPYIQATSGSLYFIVADPTLFPYDIIKASTFRTITYFYQLVHVLLGPNMTSPYYLFPMYVVSCGLVGWALYAIGKLVGNEKAVGYLVLVLLLVDKSPFTGYLSITRPDYNYQHFTLPFLLFAVYFLLKEKNLLFSLFMVFSFYFHLRNSIAFGFAVLPLIVYRIIEEPKVLKAFLLPGLLLLPKALMLLNSQHVQSLFSPVEKAEYFQLMFAREQEEGGIVFNEAGTIELIVYTMVAAVGIFTTRSVQNKDLRRSIYLCHAGVYLAFALGILMRILDHFRGPIGEVMMLGYGRASVAGTFLTMATLANYAYQAFQKHLQAKNLLMLGVFVCGVWFLSSNNLYVKSLEYFVADFFSLKMLIKLCVAIGVAALILAVIKMSQFKIRAEHVAVMLFICALTYVGLKVPGKLYRSYKVHYQYFPLIPDFSMYDPSLQEAGQWMQKNTAKDDIILVIYNNGLEEEDYCNGGFRMASRRSLWCQDFAGTYGNAETFREWKRRRAVLREYLGQPFEQWQSLIDQEDISYVVARKNIAWPNRNGIAFENEGLAIYDVRHKLLQQ